MRLVARQGMVGSSVDDNPAREHLVSKWSRIHALLVERFSQDADMLVLLTCGTVNEVNPDHTGKNRRPLECSTISKTNKGFARRF